MDSQDSPHPKLGGSHHLPLYSIICTWPRGQHPNVILSWDSQVGIPKFSKLGFLQLWKPITLRANLRLRWNLKQSCIPCQELSNGMWHHLHARESGRFPTFSGWESNCQFDFRLFFLAITYVLSTPNGSCELILDI